MVDKFKEDKNILSMLLMYIYFSYNSWFEIEVNNKYTVVKNITFSIYYQQNCIQIFMVWK